MNAGIIPNAPRGLSVSSEARIIMADWLRRTRLPRPRPDTRAMLIQRYPRGLFSEAELQALVTIIED
ncbi:hypothetical protein IFR09_25350 [Pseudomonas syringae]|nr:hypothetical protein [Pseudomonas syringae]MBD8576587.1 hypothetical protein [Pseudomonas syringae]MBD8792135.1 hypothetical protein [Pseudomonas syringae]MBD8803397.1 hypothetical protein [Pseudomonas syringae]MBD8814495.1 hypothetical protein [Pseudomonas syringae]